MDVRCTKVRSPFPQKSPLPKDSKVPSAYPPPRRLHPLSLLALVSHHAGPLTAYSPPSFCCCCKQRLPLAKDQALDTLLLCSRCPRTVLLWLGDESSLQLTEVMGTGGLPARVHRALKRAPLIPGIVPAIFFF